MLMFTNPPLTEPEAGVKTAHTHPQAHTHSSQQVHGFPLWCEVGPEKHGVIHRLPTWF